MTAPRRALAIGLILVAPALAPAIAAPTAACASGTGPHAALVVDTGSAVEAVCVALDGPSVSGLHLIELAASQRGLTYAFGFGGAAVCRLDGTGPSSGDCFADYPDFWGYWHGDGNGGWTWSSTGPGDSSVGDGDVEGWVWSSGDTAGTHDRPPATTAAEVCTPPHPSQPPSAAAAHPAPPSSSAVAPPVVTPTPTPVTGAGRSATATPTRSTSTRTARRAAGVAVRAAGPQPTAGGDASPIGLFAAIGVGLALGAGGWLRLRSSRRAAR
jgi:hypothetical protein